MTDKPTLDELARERAKAMIGQRGAILRIIELDQLAETMGHPPHALEHRARAMVSGWDLGMRHTSEDTP